MAQEVQYLTYQHEGLTQDTQNTHTVRQGSVSVIPMFLRQEEMQRKENFWKFPGQQTWYIQQ